MRYEIAYSLEFGEVITAERAYELFWANLIKDKRAFQCPGQDCTVQVTCANLDALEQDLKVQPNYRYYGSHGVRCDFEGAEGLSGSSSGSQATGSGHIPALDPHSPDVFHLSRPAVHSVRLTAQSDTAKPAIKKSHSSSARSQNSGKSRQRHYYSVANFVSRWLRFRKKDQLEQAHIQFNTTTLTYKQLFRGVYKQNVEKLLSIPSVYWGKAWEKPLDSGKGYRISFNEKMYVDGKPVSPSLLIYNTVIAQSIYRKRLLTNLENAIKEHRGGCILFVFGTPVIKHKFECATESSTCSYINFHIDNIDMVDIHPLKLYSQLNRSA